MLDLSLAAAHHLLIFALFAVLIAEFVLTREGVGPAGVRALGRVDPWYGVLAAAILAVGFSRAVFAAKGWAYYSVNVHFWAKVAVFGLIGLLSIPPTLRFIAWRKALQADGAAAPAAADVRRARRFIWAQLALFPLLPLLAAAMARGYGVVQR